MKSSKADNESKKSGKSSKSAVQESPPKPKSRTSPSRSPARGRKTSPAPKASRRSPARKSPSRKSPSRKSPSRKSPSRKSPARKSPSRNAKEIEEVPKSPSRRPAIKLESSKSSTDASKSLNLKVEVTRISRPRQMEVISKEISLRTRTDNDDNLNGGDTLIGIREGLRERRPRASEEPISKFGSRKSIRLKEATESFEKLLNLAQSTKLPKSDLLYENFSDGENLSEDESIPKKAIAPTRTLATPHRDLNESNSVMIEFGGRFGVLLQMIFLLALVFGINMICNASQCSFSSWPNLRVYSKLDTWFSLKSLLVYSSFVAIQMVTSLIPYFGQNVKLPDQDVTFSSNSVFSFFVTVSIIVTLELFDIPIFHIIYSEYFRLLTVASIFGIVIGSLLYVSSKNIPDEKRNAYGNTGFFFYDFWMGREVNPCFLKKIHVKLLLFRCTILTAILINVVILYEGLTVKNIPIFSYETAMELVTYKQLVSSVSCSSTLLLFVSMQVVYTLHALINEAKFFGTFEYLYEGTGLMVTLGYSLYPFTTMLINKYILEHSVVLSNYALALVFVVYLIGFYIYHTSNMQKSLFRTNPMDPKLAHFDSLPTFHGKRLLISGWWGFVRHPNYLGDIIIHLSWAAATITAPPVIFILFTVIFLAQRSSRDGARCRQRYGAAWDRYCRRVPYNLVPKIY